MSARRRAPALLALLLAALTAFLVAPVAALATDVPAPPGPWSASGPGSTALSDGSRYRPLLGYATRAPEGQPAATTTWTFSAVATVTGRLSFPYDWAGHHGAKGARAQLSTYVEGGATASLVDAAPSSLFRYRGTAVIDVRSGQRYGFRLRGSNADDGGKLVGALYLGDGSDAPAAPYLDAAAVASNTSWPNAADLVETVTGRVTAPGEARWYRFPVVPGSSQRLDLSGLSDDLDLAVYKDIGAAFTAATAPTDVARIAQEFSLGDAYAPSIYSPSIYSPSIYSPSIYSPSIYSPSIYSPSIYSPSIYSPSIYSPSIYSPSIYSPSIYSPSIYSPSIYSPDPSFLTAFSSAQTRSLLAVAATPGSGPETLRTQAWNNTGSFYVRVQGRDAAVSSFTLRLTRTGGPCEGVRLDPMTPAPEAPSPTSSAAVVLTDTARLGLTGQAAADLRTSLARLGDVVDAAALPRLVALNAQADAAPSCTYAKNLVAEALRDVVDSKRGDGLRSVVLAGDDAVVPFFRYPDTSGLAPESQFSPPVRGGTASDASLRSDQVLGQDAYGALVDVSVKGSVVPVPDLAVGRLVETPAEISGQVDEFVRTAGRLDLSTSLVTGYDFLQDAADAVVAQFDAGLGTPAARLITPSGALPAEGWTADDLRGALLPAGGAGAAPDLVYLAGHFSANSALAADNETSLLTRDLAARPLALRGSLVMSAGCHSGYGIVDADGFPGGLTDGLDWAQEMARQKAVLVAGTGYQYGDTDFLEYGERLYLGVAEALRAGTAGTPVAIGDALVAAKQEYLETTATLAGIDQKTLIEATVFGIPMTGVDLPGRLPAAPVPPRLDVTPVTTAPGSVLGLATAALDVVPATTVRTKALQDLAGTPNGLSARWLEGPDGVVVAPAAPALPKQVLDVTGPAGTVLRGVGLRSGAYTDTRGVLPLTGAPAVEQNGIHTTFSAPAFFPQQLFRTNHYDALGAGGTDGRTRLIVTPAQYRSETPGSATAVERRYSRLGLRLFSSPLTVTGGAGPALAAPPSLSSPEVRVSGSTVTVRARVTGDPTAGIQSVWTTYTADRGAWAGRYDSLDLVQDTADSTLWTGSLTLPADVPPSAARFVLQAVNGAGVVGVEGLQSDGLAPLPPGVNPAAVALSVTAPGGGTVGGTTRVTATGLPAGAPVRLGVGPAAVDTTADASGRATADVPLRVQAGSYPATAVYAGSPAFRPASATSAGAVVVARAATALSITPRPAGGPYDEPADVVLTTGGLPLAERSVQLTVVRDGVPVARVVRASGPDGKVPFASPLPLGARGTLTAAFGEVGEGLLPDVAHLPSSASAALPGRTTATATIADGAGQTAAPGAPYAAPLVVRVADDAGRPVPGAVVTVAAASPATGAVVTVAGSDRTTVTTGPDGRVAVPVRAGTVPGTARLSVTGADVTGAVASLLVDVPEQTGRLQTGILTPPLPDGSLPSSAGSPLQARVQVLRADGSVLSGAAAQALADRCGIVLRARPTDGGPGTPTGASPCLRYSPLESAFRYDATAQEFGWRAGERWTLQVFLRAGDGTAFGRSTATVTFTSSTGPALRS